MDSNDSSRQAGDASHTPQLAVKSCPDEKQGGSLSGCPKTTRGNEGESGKG